MTDSRCACTEGHVDDLHAVVGRGALSAAHTAGSEAGTAAGREGRAAGRHMPGEVAVAEWHAWPCGGG